MNNTYLLSDVVITSDGQDRFGDKVKKSSQFNTSEIIQTSFLYDFLSNYLSQDKVLVHPTVYSDKSSHYKLLIDLTKKLNIVDSTGNSFETKELSKMTPKEMDDTLHTTMGSMYKNLVGNLISDYRNLFLEFSEQEIADYNLDPAILSNPTSSWNDIKSVVSKLNSNILNTLAKRARAKGKDVNIAEEVHYSKNGGIPGVNALIDYYYRLYTNKNKTLYDSRIATGKKKLLKNFLEYSPNIYLTYSDGKENSIIRRALTKFPEVERKWVNKNTNALILGKINGKVIDIHNYKEILNDKTIHESNDKVELNPLLDLYYSINQLINTNFTALMVGHPYFHPAKGNVIPTELDVSNRISSDELGESLRQLAQYKRMVILPATLNTFLQKRLNGIPSYYKVAVVDDISADVYNYTGNQSQTSPHDGSAFSNGLIAILENMSLQDSKVGLDKKPIGHAYNPKYGTASLLKYALFAIDNERMRTSSNSDISLKNLFKRMVNHKWDIPLDLTKNFKGENRSLNDVIISDVYYKSGNRYYKLLEMENIGDNLYYLSKVEVNKNGVPISDVTYNTSHIDTNYKLWENLGGEYSMKLNNNQLEFSDDSLYNTVEFMNKTGVFKTEENSKLYNNSLEVDKTVGYKTLEEIESTLYDQDSVYQPMKYSMISYNANRSSFKNGIENLNPSKMYFEKDGSIETMRIDTYNLGVQMDADHEADLSLITEMSQVISAIEENGYTHNISQKVYQDLAKIVAKTVVEELNAVNKAIDTGDNIELYNLVGKSVFKILSKGDNSVGLSKKIIDEIALDIENLSADSELKIPFSDSNLLSLTVSTISSSLNRTAIKRKFPGIASVLVPSYNIIQLYDVNNKLTYFDDIEGITYPDVEYTKDTSIPSLYLSDESGIKVNTDIAYENFVNKVWANSMQFSDGSYSKTLEYNFFEDYTDYLKFTLNYVKLYNTEDQLKYPSIGEYHNSLVDQIINSKKVNYLQSLQDNDNFITNNQIELEGAYDVYDQSDNLIESGVILNNLSKYSYYRSNRNLKFKKSYKTPLNLKPSVVSFNIGKNTFSMFDMPALINAYNKGSEVTLEDRAEVQKAFEDLDSGMIGLPFSIQNDLINNEPELINEYSDVLFIIGGQVVPIYNI